ncbi:choline dehydrogenase, partial [Microbacterium sp. SUBG005]
YAFEGEDGMPVAAMSSNVGGMAAHWTGACPRPNDSERIAFVDDLDELLDEGDRLLGVTKNAFDSALGRSVRERLAAAVDAGRAMPRRCGGCRSPCTAATTAVWSGRARTSSSEM